MSHNLAELYPLLDQRLTPEAILQKVIPLVDTLSPLEQSRLRQIAQSARHSYMSTDFARVPPMNRQLGVASAVFGVAAPEDGLSKDEIDRFIDTVETLIHVKRGKTDYKHDRLDRAARKREGIGQLSRRKYNKMFRITNRLEEKERKVLLELEKRGLTQVAKSGLASKIPQTEFISDAKTVAFILYYAAQKNTRSVFTNAGQKNAFDEVAATLLHKCEASPTTNWYAIAHIHPTPEVVARLTSEQKTTLLAVLTKILKQTATMLQGVWDASDINKKTMTVQRGNDSSTWNAMAGAWNAARTAWMSFVYAIGADSILDDYCPGKCMRLIAGDVAAWHHQSGHTGDPNQHVWYDLPMPWEVFTGRSVCSRETVAAVCAKHGVDPHKSGWISPRECPQVAEFQPTPELVHGVVIANPDLVPFFKKWKYFSGKASSQSVFNE